MRVNKKQDCGTLNCNQRTQSSLKEPMVLWGKAPVSAKFPQCHHVAHKPLNFKETFRATLKTTLGIKVGDQASRLSKTKVTPNTKKSKAPSSQAQKSKATLGATTKAAASLNETLQSDLTSSKTKASNRGMEAQSQNQSQSQTQAPNQAQTSKLEVRSIIGPASPLTLKDIVLGLEGEVPFPDDGVESTFKEKRRGICLMFLYLAIIAVVIMVLELHNVYLFKFLNDKVLSQEMLRSRCINDTWLTGDCHDAIEHKDSNAAVRIAETYQQAAQKIKPNREKLLQDFWRYYFKPQGYYADYARYWYTKAAALNNRVALYELYKVYTKTEEKSRVANEMLLRSSAAQGYAPALLEMYEHNIGGSRKYNFKLLQKSAASGHVPAQVILGREYAEGIVVERNAAKAQLWLIRAVRRGSLAAMLELVRLYASSEGELPEAKIRHYAWAQHFYNCQKVSEEALELDFDYSVMVKMYRHLSSTFTPREAKRAGQVINNILRDYPCVQHSPSSKAPGSLENEAEAESELSNNSLF